MTLPGGSHSGVNGCEPSYLVFATDVTGAVVTDEHPAPGCPPRRNSDSVSEKGEEHWTFPRWGGEVGWMMGRQAS